MQERVQRVHLHPSKFGNGCNAPVLVNDCPLKGSSLSKKGKKREKLVLKSCICSFFGEGVHSLSPWNCFAPLLLKPWLYPCTLLQGGCKSKNQCLQIRIKYTFLYSKWRITLEKVQNWSFHCFNSARWAYTFLSFTSKTWSKLTNSIILASM